MMRADHIREFAIFIEPSEHIFDQYRFLDFANPIY